MRRLALPLLAISLLVTPSGASAGAGHANRSAHVARTAVFWYGISDSPSRRGVGDYSVVLYDNGTVSLQGSRYLHLRHPHVIQPRAVIDRLLRLAEQQGFFALPASFGHPIPDAGTPFLSVTDAAEAKTVTAYPATDTREEEQEQTRFGAVYGAVAELTPICFKKPGTKRTCWR